MRKLSVFFVLLLCSVLAMASDTPTLGLHRPAHGDASWGVTWNQNADTLDAWAAGIIAELAHSVIASGVSVTLTAPRQYYICTSTCTVVPPVPSAGYEFCVKNDVGISTVITLAALGSSARYGKVDQSAYGTAGTGTLVSGGALGDKVCLVGKDSTHYDAWSASGTWTAN